MKLKSILFIAMLFGSFHGISANSISSNTEVDTIPFYEVPDAPEMYSAATVAARVIEGLGFRYRWATEGLRAEDLAYEPGNEGQSCSAVLEHILGLSRFIYRTVNNENHDNSRVYPDLNWEEQRKETLKNFEMASGILRETGDVSTMKIIFKRGEKTSEFPFWNLLNGPISDAIYHTGQIVSFRRTTGNPINSNLSMLRGIVRE